MAFAYRLEDEAGNPADPLQAARRDWSIGDSIDFGRRRRLARIERRRDPACDQLADQKLFWRS
jgi:hypothetical protein